MADKEFKLGIVIDSSGAVKGIEDATGAFIKFNQATEESTEGLGKQAKSLDKAGDESDEYSGQLDQAFKVTVALNQALEIAQKVFGAVSGAIKETTAAYGIQEQAEVGVANAMRLTGTFTESGLQGWKDWASALQLVTTTGDEATLEMIKTATALGLNEEQTKQAIKASLDLAAATGKNVDGTFRQLLQTYSGTATALQRMGIDTSNLTKEQIQNGAAVELVATKFEGLAEAQTKTFTGSQIQSANAFGDVLEEIGKLFAEVLGLAGGAQAMAQFWMTVGTAVSDFREILLSTKQAIGAVLNMPWEKLSVAAGIVGVLTASFITFQVVVVGLNPKILGFIANLVLTGKAALATSAKMLLMSVKFAAVAAGIATIVLALDFLVRNINRVGDVFTVFGKIIVAAFSNIKGVVQTVLAEVLYQLANTVAGFKGFAEAVGGAISWVLNRLKAFANAVGADDIAKKIGGMAQAAVPALKKGMVAIENTIRKGSMRAARTADIRFGIAEKNRQEIKQITSDMDTGLGGELIKTIGKIQDGVGKAPIIPSIDTNAIAPAVAGMEKIAEVTKEAREETEKFTEAQKAALNLVKSNATAQIQINEFGKKGTNLVLMRRDARLEELSALQKTLAAEGNLTPALLRNIEQAKSNQLKLAGLKIAQDAAKQEQDATNLSASMSQKLIDSGQQRNLLGRNQIQVIALQNQATNQAIALEQQKLTTAGKMTPQLRMTFGLLQKNNDAAALFKIGEIKTDAIEQLRDETDALLMSQLEGDDLAQAKLDKDLEAIEAKREELQLAGLLTKEAEKLLAVQSQAAVTSATQTQDTGGGGGGGVDVGAIASGISDGMEAGADFISGAMDSFANIGSEQMVASLTSALESFPDMIARGMDAFPDIMIKAVDSFVEGLDVFIAKLPEFITKIFDALPEIIDKIFAAFTRLVESLPAILSQILSSLGPIISQILEQLPELILSIFDSLGDMVVILMDALPGLFMRVMEALPDIIEAFVEGLVSNMGKIVIGFIDTFIIEGGAFKMFASIFEAMLIKIPIAIVKGVFKGLQKIFKMLFDGIEIPLSVPPAVTELPGKLEDAVSSVAEGIKAGGGDVFALVDLAKSKSAKAIDKSIGEATRRAAAHFKQTFKTIGGWLGKLWDALKAIWDTVIMWLGKLWAIIEQIWDVVMKALQILWDAIEAIWDVVVELLQALWDALEVIWDAVVEALQVLWDAIEAIWDVVVEALQALWDALEEIWDAVYEGLQAIWDALEEVWEGVYEGLQAIWDALEEVWDGVEETLEELWEDLEEIWDGIEETWDGLMEDLEEVWDGIEEGLNTITTKFKEAGEEVAAALQVVWDWFKENILDKVTGIFTEAATAILEVINSVPGKFQEAVSKITTAISEVPGKFAEAAGNITSAIAGIPGKFQEGISALGDAVSGLGSKMYSSFKSAFSGMGTWVGDKIKDALKAIDPANLLKKMFKVDGKGKGTVEKLLDINVPWANFAGGGIVPGQALVPGDSIRNDTVAAMVSPGEAIIPRSIMNDPEVARVVSSILGGNLDFAFGGMSISNPIPSVSISAPKLPTMNDITSMNTQDLIDAVSDNLQAFADMAFGDVWDLFKDKVLDQLVGGLMAGIKANAAGFAEGGPVMQGGIAQVHTGEFVMNQDMLGGLANAIREGQNQKASGDVVLNATVNMVGGEGGNKVSGKKIIDEMFVELRRRSANQKIMFESGLI